MNVKSKKKSEYKWRERVRATDIGNHGSRGPRLRAVGLPSASIGASVAVSRRRSEASSGQRGQYVLYLRFDDGEGAKGAGARHARPASRCRRTTELALPLFSRRHEGGEGETVVVETKCG